MKILNIKEPADFFETVRQCKGTVELVTSEGDRLNLKSKLCQYIALTQMFGDAKIEDFDLVLSEPRDLALIARFIERAE